MSEHRILIFEGQAHLSVNLGRLTVNRPNQPVHHILPDDIDVIVIHHNAITFTSQLIDICEQFSISLLFIGNNHYPTAILSSLNPTTQTVRRLHQQISFHSDEAKKECWLEIVKAKIHSQISVLEMNKKTVPVRLRNIVNEVKPADLDNKEAEAARIYWSALFGDDFKREKQGASELTNICLNYGYAILRSLLARQLAIYGLTPSLGIHHENFENPYNLVDDFMEPFRFLIDHAVYGLIKDNNVVDFDKNCRLSLLRAMLIDLPVNKSIVRTDTAVSLLIESFIRVLADRNKKLIFPRYELWVAMDGE